MALLPVLRQENGDTGGLMLMLTVVFPSKIPDRQQLMMSSAFLAILRGLNFTLKQVSFNLIILYAEYFDDHTLSGRH